MMTTVIRYLKKSGKVGMEVNRLMYRCIEIYKSINNINPSQVKKSLRYYVPKIWNSLPFHVKTSENLKT